MILDTKHGSYNFRQKKLKDFSRGLLKKDCTNHVDIHVSRYVVPPVPQILKSKSVLIMYNLQLIL